MRGYRITIDGRAFEVRLLSDPHGDRVEVEVDGRTLVVDVQDLGRDDGRSRPAVPAPAPDVALAAGARESSAAPLPAPRAAPTARTVAAPLPGVVKSVAVRQGQRVGPGDELLVIEAMKMDNVIRAGREGVVEAVHVAEGHRVAHGQPLIEYRQ
ncbi:MAG: biotin/lipoyl-containing protein [Anaerolineae bacterium]|jgi:biotin carboxyl carrier protein